MKLIFKTTFACFTVIAMHSLAQAAFDAGGVGDGGTGGQITFELNPWRVGPEPIEYCIERAANFPQSRKELSHLVSESFADWRRFFVRYKMDQPFTANFPNFPKLSLPSSTHEVSTCTNLKTQIRFVFGVKSQEMRQMKAQYPERLLAFAHRTSYDKKRLQGAGVVWFSPQNAYTQHTGPIETTFPDWTWRPSLKHQVLHEIGHIFGMAHGSTWVMEPEVMHAQLWATLRHASIPNESNQVVPLGTIEAPFMSFDPLSGENEIPTCAKTYCQIAPEIPMVIQNALGLQIPAEEFSPQVTIRFARSEAGSYRMTIKVAKYGVEKTVELRAQTLHTERVPSLYVSGDYNPDIAWLRQVSGGTFNSVLVGGGFSVPMSIVVESADIKITVFDASTGTWIDWFNLASPYVENPQN